MDNPFVADNDVRKSKLLAFSSTNKSAEVAKRKQTSRRVAHVFQSLFSISLVWVAQDSKHFFNTFFSS